MVDFVTPWRSTAALTTNATPQMGTVNRYNVSAGGYTVTLPPLSGLNAGARTAIEKDRLDNSGNAITVSRLGSDTFDDGTTSFLIVAPGSQETVQVVTIGGVKRWKRFSGGTAASGTGDLSSNATFSVENEVAVFTGNTGKIVKRSTLTGLAKLVAGVLSAAQAGVDYLAPGGALGTPSSGTLTNVTGLPVGGVAATGTPSGTTFLRGDGVWSTPAGGGDASTNTTTSVDSELPVFSGTGGKLFKRATLTGLAKLTSGVLSAAQAGVDYVSPSSTETQTNKTFTAPKIANGGYIADANGNEQLVFNSVASAVNGISITNAATGTGATIAAWGSDPNQDININGQGTGRVYLSGDRAVTATFAQIITNKDFRSREATITSSATPAIDLALVDLFTITALAVNITSMTSGLTNLPTYSKLLWIGITGTAARTIIWGAKFVDSTVALPTTTVSTNRIDVGLIYDVPNAVFRCVAVA